MELTTQGFYVVKVFTKDNKKEFKNYYVAADSTQEATAIVEDKLKKDNIFNSVYINSILNTGHTQTSDCPGHPKAALLP